MTEPLQPVKQIVISKKAVDFIVCEEVTSSSYYSTHYAHPTWPGGDSGITIGIGYDLGYESMQQIKNDWFGWLKQDELQEIMNVQGIRGEIAKSTLLKNNKLQKIAIPYAGAYIVFVNNTLP